MTLLERFLERLQNATNLDDIQGLVTALRDEFDVDHAIYHVVGATGAEYGALTYDPDWVSHYIANRYFNVDPVVAEAMSTTRPLNWSALDWSPKPARDLLGEATAEGVGKQGWSIPVHGPGGQLALFSVTSYKSDSQWVRFGTAHLHDLVLAAHCIHDRVAELSAAPPAPETALTPRERDVLSLLSLGRSRGQAADQLTISEHTLRAHVDSARQKLGAQNITHAVATAMSRGLLVL